MNHSSGWHPFFLSFFHISSLILYSTILLNIANFYISLICKAFLRYLYTISSDGNAIHYFIFTSSFLLQFRFKFSKLNFSIPQFIWGNCPSARSVMPEMTESKHSTFSSFWASPLQMQSCYYLIAFAYSGSKQMDRQYIACPFAYSFNILIEKMLSEPTLKPRKNFAFRTTNLQ